MADSTKSGLLDKKYMCKFGLFLPVFNAASLTNQNVNMIYTELGIGCYILLVSSGFSNFPFQEQGGLLIHVQRSGINSVTTSQLIYQKAISSIGIKERVGHGNGSSIVYGEWQ